LLRAGLEARSPGSSVSVFNRSAGGFTAGDLARLHAQDVAYFGRDMEGITVVHCGVVDCAPRPIPPQMRTRLAALPILLRWPVAKMLHLLRPLLLRVGLLWRISTAEQFEHSMRTLLQALEREKAMICVVNITPALPGVEAHSPGFSDSIRAYNEILARCLAGTSARLIDAHGAVTRAPGGTSAYLTSKDGYHLTASAHALISQLILEQYDARFAAERAAS
jgi:lysophospholipase L1-like esterase